YQKVETRIIVARHATPGPDGKAVQNALFGTYNWSDDERQAILVTDPLRNGKPFRDKLRTLHPDEKKYDEVVRALGGGGAGADLTRALETAGATRRYAIPGSERCVQCHMGSPSESFVLGFTPLQINRRPLGVGGIIEEPGKDDLTQLKRLMDYKVIT